MSLTGPAIVYVLCLLTSVLCATLLVRSYQRTRTRLILWSAACFVLLALNNLFVVGDMILLPGVDLSLGRQLTALAAVAVLIGGFILEAD